MLAKGASQKEAGLVLGSSHATIQKHVEELKTRLEAKSLGHAVNKAWELGIFVHDADNKIDIAEGLEFPTPRERRHMRRERLQRGE